MELLKINKYESMTQFDKSLCEFIMVCYFSKPGYTNKKILETFNITFDLGNAVFLNFRIKGSYYSLKITQENYVKAYDEWVNNKSLCIFTISGSQNIGFDEKVNKSPLDNHIVHIKTKEERMNEFKEAMHEAYQYKANNLELYADKTIKSSDEIDQMIEGIQLISNN
jgi:hypothetical protein